MTKMKTNTKLIILELIAGIFGWIWMLAGITMFVLVVLALFFGGTWWNVLWTFIASAIAKWLAKGFDDNKNRVAYEAELIDQGYSPEEAEKAWLDSYLGNRRQEKRSRPDYLALSPEEKLIFQIEENMSPREIRQLLDAAQLDYQRETDGVTSVIATMRYLPDKNYQNSCRRYRILYEIASRLPKERLAHALNAKDYTGWTALMYAASQSDALGGALLIHLGADPTIQNPEGQTAADISSPWPTVIPVFEGRDAPPNFPSLLDAQEGKWP